ncbi:MAG: uncharacterized protein JWP87_715 [Labilithrix sp.]|nr:uncharacterized protein [Labilithrix sp.]
MPLHRRPRWSPRTLRRSLLVASAVVVILVAACTPAWAADEEVWKTAPSAAPAPAPAPDSGAQLAFAPPPYRYAYTGTARPTSTRRWYGWETLMADGISLVVVPAVAIAVVPSRNGDNGGTAVGLAAASYALAPPIVHLAHGRPGIAAASLGLRLGVPVGGAMLGAAVAGDCGGSFCRLGPAAAGFVVGMVVATTIDAAVFAFEPRRDDDDERTGDEARRVEPRRAAPKTKAISFAPAGGPRKEGGFDVGLAATF